MLGTVKVPVQCSPWSWVGDTTSPHRARGGAGAQAVCVPGEGSSEEGHGGWDLWGDRELASEEEDGVPGKADGLRDRAG